MKPKPLIIGDMNTSSISHLLAASMVLGCHDFDRLAGFDSPSVIDEPPAKKELTKYDLEAIKRAEEKRARKNKQ